MVKAVTIHYTAGSPSTPILDIARYQIGPTAQAPFPAIAYHLIVDEVGDSHLLHDLDRRVWHSGAPGENEEAIGICYTGNYQPNEAQFRGLREAINWCQGELGIELEVRGHKDRYATECPGPTWPTWKSKIA